MAASGETVAAAMPPRQQEQQPALDGGALAIPVPAASAGEQEAEAGGDDAPKAAAAAAIDKAAFLRRFVESALRQAREGQPDEYQRLVRVFAYTRHGGGPQAAARYASEVAPWIPALAASVSALGLGCRELVGTVLGSDWVTVPDDGVAHRYATLVLQLVSARPEWVPQAAAALVRWFGFGARRADEAEAPRVHARAHRLLREICRAVPTSGSSVIAALGELWPFRTAKARLHVLFVRNALCCLEYAPGVRREVLRMVLNHMIQLDVEIQVELEDLESDSDDDDDDAAAADEG
ncbi:DNA independent RNA polymerase I transcription factor, partial [Coemansia helicoidea]